jgi:hypothetical protein
VILTLPSMKIVPFTVSVFVVAFRQLAAGVASSRQFGWTREPPRSCRSGPASRSRSAFQTARDRHHLVVDPDLNCELGSRSLMPP